MSNLKHVGRMVGNQRKVVIAYRVLPGDPDHCLVVQTENLDAEMHDAVIRLVESNAGQTAYEFAEAMTRARLSDGRIMLAALHTTGKLTKMPTTSIQMIPNQQTSILLSELNKSIAENKGVTVNDLALANESGVTTPEQQTTQPPVVSQESTSEVLDDEAIAKNLRSQADAMFKEAQRLRKEADELSPSKKKTTKKTTESV